MVASLDLNYAAVIRFRQGYSAMNNLRYRVNREPGERDNGRLFVQAREQEKDLRAALPVSSRTMFRFPCEEQPANVLNQ